METEAATDTALSQLLRSWHGEASEDLGGPALPFDDSAARHGALLLFRAAWCYLHRDSPAAEVTALLRHSLPGLPSAEAQFAADLTLQHLPALFRMAQALAPGDPLLPALSQIAWQWPLSAVGVPRGENEEPGADPGAWQSLHDHPGLRQLFLDRVLQRADHSWSSHPEVASWLLYTLGAHAPILAPTLQRPSFPLHAG